MESLLKLYFIQMNHMLHQCGGQRGHFTSEELWHKLCGCKFEGYSGETIIVYKKTFYVSDNLHVSVCNAYMIIVIGLGLRIASVECNVY